MAFKKGVSGNPAGRPTADKLISPKSVSGQEVKEKELKIMLRGMKPLTRKAMERLGHMLGDDWDRSSQNERIRIIGLVMKEYQSILSSAYPTENKTDNDVDQDELQLAPLISLKVVE